MRSDQRSLGFRVGHCHVQLTVRVDFTVINNQRLGKFLDSSLEKHFYLQDKN